MRGPLGSEEEPVEEQEDMSGRCCMQKGHTQGDGWQEKKKEV